MSWEKCWASPLEDIFQDLNWQLQGTPKPPPEKLSFVQKCSRWMGWSQPPQPPLDPWKGIYTRRTRLEAVYRFLKYVELDLEPDQVVKLRINCCLTTAQEHLVAEKQGIRRFRKVFLELEFGLKGLGRFLLEVERQAKGRQRPGKERARLRDRIRLRLPEELQVGAPLKLPKDLELRQWEGNRLTLVGPKGFFYYRKGVYIKNDEPKLDNPQLWWKTLALAVQALRSVRKSQKKREP